MKRWILYRHTSPLGKVYIGITSQNNVKIRWCRGCPYFFHAILKYGWDNIKHEVLFANLEEDRAKNLEKELIRHYKNLNISYNITDGGDGTLGVGCSEENKEKKRGPRDRGIVEKVRASRLANGKRCTKEMIQANIERNLSRCSLLNCLAGRNGSKTCKGYIWKYKY